MSAQENKFEDNGKNTFVRVLIVFLSLFIFFLIVYKYLYTYPKGEISSGIVILVSFLIILSLSEAFDNFSVGTIFSLQKTLKEKNSDISQLKTENLELRNQIVKVSTSVSQGQMNASFINLQEVMSSFVKVKPAEKQEIEEKAKTELKEENDNVVGTTITSAYVKRETTTKRIDQGKLEEIGINKYIEDYKLQHYSFIKEVKLSMDFYNIDPISSFAPLFDGYIKTPEDEIFIEVKNNSNLSFIFRERLYFLLSKIYHYKQVKKSNAYLVLILINTKENEIKDRSNSLNRFFEPAISSSLLRIITYTLDESESSEIYTD